MVSIITWNCGYGWGFFAGGPYKTNEPCPGCHVTGRPCALPRGHPGPVHVGREAIEQVLTNASRHMPLAQKMMDMGRELGRKKNRGKR